MFSSLQNLSKNRRGPGQAEQFEEALAHIKFVVKLYKMQVESGNYFLHEHPAGATSWDTEEIRKMTQGTGVQITVADQCMYGLRTWSKDPKKLDKPARKRTKFMTNGVEIAEELKKRCDLKHEHQALVDGRAREAAQYPQELCVAIVKGLIKQIQVEAMQIRHLLSVTATDRISDPSVQD